MGLKNSVGTSKRVEHGYGKLQESQALLEKSLTVSRTWLKMLVMRSLTRLLIWLVTSLTWLVIILMILNRGGGLQRSPTRPCEEGPPQLRNHERPELLSYPVPATTRRRSRRIGRTEDLPGPNTSNSLWSVAGKSLLFF